MGPLQRACAYSPRPKLIRACLKRLLMDAAGQHQRGATRHQNWSTLFESEFSIMHIPHELQEEFPGEASLIERLKKTNYEFGRLASRYDEVNRGIYRIETEEEPTADEVAEELKKQRLKLKDEIASILTKVERRM